MVTFRLTAGLMALALMIGMPAWAQDEAPLDGEAQAQAEMAEPGMMEEMSPPTGFDEQGVWWGNRSISHDNYIKFQPIGGDCIGICRYCNTDGICCQTGCPCVNCEYICDDCDNCPPADFDKFFFDLDKAVLRPEGMAECEKVAAHLKANPAENVVIQGHTCDIDQDSYNMNLGLRRANAVRDCLISRGINPSRITTESYGESSPWVTPAQRELNRRAVVKFVPAN